MNTHFFHRIKNWLLQFLQIQLLLSIIMLPMLANWGFPISLLSPLGNIIFLPFFIIFLLFASLIFFFELFYIPNDFLIYFFEKINEFYIYYTQIDTFKWLVGFTKPPIWLSITLPIAAFAILSHKRTKNIYHNIIMLGLLFLFACVYLKIIKTPKSYFTQIECSRGNVTIIHENGKTVVIDPGYIGQRISAQSWMQYTLVPEIAKICGSTTIDHIILLQPSKLLFEALPKLFQIISVKTIHLIYWQGNMQKSCWKSFFAMKEASIKNNITFKRIANKSQLLSISKSMNLSITPINKTLSYMQARFSAFRITGKIDNKEFQIYSSKYK